MNVRYVILGILAFWSLSAAEASAQTWMIGEGGQPVVIVTPNQWQTLRDTEIALNSTARPWPGQLIVGNKLFRIDRYLGYGNDGNREFHSVKLRNPVSFSLGGGPAGVALNPVVALLVAVWAESCGSVPCWESTARRPVMAVPTTQRGHKSGGVIVNRPRWLGTHAHATSSSSTQGPLIGSAVR